MLRNLLIITCLLGTVYITYGQKKRKSKDLIVPPTEQTGVNYKELGSPLPELRVVNEKKAITSKDLQNDANLFVVMFNPTCEHCQDIAMDLRKNMDTFKNNKFVWVCSAAMPMGHLDFFRSVTKIDKTPMEMGLDSCKLIDRAFIYGGLPQINIYDKDRKLVHIFAGEIALDSLKMYAN